tara:strand:- start:6376 stop:7476 length:1101 start_codon:yes stop_codon:yes gene_type:complete
LSFEEEKPLLSFIVPASQVKYLEEVILSIQNQKKISFYEVVVVLNGLPKIDELIKKFKEKFKDVRFLVCEKRNAAYARNFGVKYARGEFLAFIDSDCVLSDDWACSLIQEMQGIYSCASSAIIPTGDGKRFLDKFRLKLKDQVTGGSFVCSLPHVEITLPVVNTAACIYRASLFRGLDGFDEELRRCEDTELSYRAYQEGCNFFLNADSKAFVYYGGGVLKYIGRFFFDTLYFKVKLGKGNCSFASYRFSNSRNVNPLDYLLLWAIKISSSMGSLGNKILKRKEYKLFGYLNLSKDYRNLMFRKKVGERVFYLSPYSRVIKIKKTGKTTLILREGVGQKTIKLDSNCILDNFILDNNGLFVTSKRV